MGLCPSGAGCLPGKKGQGNSEAPPSLILRPFLHHGEKTNLCRTPRHPNRNDSGQPSLAVIPANVLGSMTAAVMAFLFGITNSVAHGGPIVALLGAVNKPLLALLCMICGAIVTGVVAVALKKLRVKKSDEVTLAKAA